MDTCSKASVATATKLATREQTVRSQGKSAAKANEVEEAVEMAEAEVAVEPIVIRTATTAERRSMRRKIAGRSIQTRQQTGSRKMRQPEQR